MSTVRPCRVRTPAGSRPRVGRCSRPVRNARESASMRLRTRLAALALSLLGLSGLAALRGRSARAEGEAARRPLPRRQADAPAARSLRADRPGPRGSRDRGDLHREGLGPEPRDARQVRRPGRSTPTRRRSRKDQEKALLDYVAGGGGFVPLHCASFCFLNSPEYVALVGAQFQKHGTGEFETKVVDPDHPIIKGLEPFRTWDETYVHTKHNAKDRHVLQTRDDQAGAEPWTWTRTQGKGRVFYTAYGHDARTWGHPGFHDLVERGIRWAANKGDVFDSRPRVAKGLKPFEYEPAEIPLYTPGARWGTLGEPIRKMQKPLAPEESIEAPRGARRVRGEAVRRRAADRQADHDDLGPPRPALGRRDGRLPQRDAAEGQGPRPDHDRRGHRRRRQGRQVHRLRRGAEHPDEPLLRQRRPDRRAGPRHALPQGHRRRRQGRRAQGPLHRLGHARHPRRAEQPAVRARQLDLRDRRLLRLRRRRSAASGTTSARGSSGSSRTARSWSSSAARTTTRGASASARRASSSARRPTAARASTCRSRTATTSRSAAGRPAVLAEHRRLEPLLPDHRERPAGRLARRVHRRRRPRALHGADLPEAVLEPDGLRRRADRAPRRHVHAAPGRHATSARTTPGTSWPATTSGPRRSWPRSARTATSG